MKSFRIYLAPGRVLTAAGWAAVAAAVTTIVAGLVGLDIWVPLLAADPRGPLAKAFLVAAGGFVFATVGGVLRLLKLPLSKPEPPL